MRGWKGASFGGDAEQSELLAEIGRLCDGGRFTTALGVAEQLGPFETWRSTEALCCGARLVGHLGARKRSRKLALTAFRRDPRSALARFWIDATCMGARGPLGALAFLDGCAPPDEASAVDRVHYFWSRGMNALAFRDFDAADRWLLRAEDTLPGDPYGGTLRVSWLSAQDRYDEALDFARENQAKHPGHRAAVEALADMLQVAARHDEALAVLAESSAALESGALQLSIARLEHELGRYQSALDSIGRAERLLPLLEDEGKQMLAGLRSDAAYFSGDIERAIAEAKLAGPGFFADLAPRLEARRTGKRAQLPVGFVRQHHLTCVPATLATLGRFWQRDVDHLELAERICYDGTPAHSERQWAKQNGWLTREFTTDWETSMALVERGIPFVVTTVQAVSAHAQAVIGYDQRRGTLFIRDPYVPATVEAAATAFFERYRAHGPRGFALVPDTSGELFDGLSFPDRELYELNEDLEAALDCHDRERALARSRELDARAPNHHLAYLARRAIASYDANPHDLERVAEQALATFPHEPTWLITQLNALRETSTSSRVRERLEDITRGDDVHPVFEEMLAAELLEDGRELDRAGRILRRVASMLPERAVCVGLLARAAWRKRDFERGLALYRLAACLEPTSEGWARAYFQAAFARGESDSALEFLRQRAARYAGRAAAPAISLFSALEWLDRASEAFDSLERALAARPDDAELLCFAAEARARYGQFDVAEACLADAKPRAPPSAWRKTAATVARFAGDHERAIELHRESVESEPFSLQAHAGLCERLAAVHGPAKAREHIAKASARFPNNAALLRLAVEWHDAEAPAPHEALVRRLLELEPVNAWARRELALTLARSGQTDAAREECRLALEVAPDQAASQLVLARVLELAGDFPGARQAYARALEIFPDSELTISRMMELAAGRTESIGALDQIEQQVARGSRNGEGVLVWYGEASRRLAPDELSRRLGALHEQRGDLPAVWQCVARHARATGDLSTAIEVARSAGERFPLVPAIWLELSRALRAAKRKQDEIAAIERALAISPGDVDATLLLADALDRRGAADHGLPAIERGLRFNPLEAPLLLARADVLWRLRRREEAVTAVRRVLEADPGESAAWSRLSSWGETGDFDPENLVRQLAERRPWDSRIWLRLAEAQAENDLRSALQTLDHVLELDPSGFEAHDLYAVFAARLGHRALALAHCHPKHFGENVPVALRGREAWVLAEFGDLAAAIAKMKEVVAEQPEYEWGFRQLAEWAERAGDTSTALEAAEALVRLAPSGAVAHGYLGEALVTAGRPVEARKAFRRSLELDPSYRFGFFRLLELWFEAGKPERARRVLDRFGPHALPSDFAYWRFRVALMDRVWNEAERALVELLLDPEAPETLITRACAIATEVDWFLARRVLRSAMEQPSAPARVGQAWAQHQLAGGEVPGVLSIWRLRRKNRDAAAAALVATLDSLGETARLIPALWLLAFNWGFMRSRLELWGAMGFVFANSGHDLLAVLWLWSYEARRPSAWMLLNLATSLRSLGFARAASGVSHDALALPRDFSFHAHSSLLALDAALEADVAEASLLAGDVGGAELAPYFQHVRELVQSIVEVETATGQERSLAVERAFEALRRLHPSPLLGLLGLDGIQWRRVSRRIARAGGSFGAYLRGYSSSVAALALAAVFAYALVLTEGSVLIWWIAGKLGVVVFRAFRRG